MEENLLREEFFLPKAINSSQRKNLVKNFWIELLVVTSWYNYLILALWAELMSVIVYHPIRKGRIIVVLPSAKLILPVDRGIFTSGGIFLTKLNQFITKKNLVKNFWVELLMVTSLYKYLILGLWAELLSALRATVILPRDPKNR